MAPATLHLTDHLTVPLSTPIYDSKTVHDFETQALGMSQRPRNEQVAPLQLQLLSAPASIWVRLSSFLRAPTRHISKG